MNTRSFHLGDILSITTGHLVSLRHMDGVYDILNFMTGDSLFTHQLPRVADECRPFLLKQHPQLGEVVEMPTRENWQEWLDRQIEKYGAELPVGSLAPGEHHFIDPISELAEKVHPDRIIPVVVDKAS